mgnify:CR=1 FL=1
MLRGNGREAVGRDVRAEPAVEVAHPDGGARAQRAERRLVDVVDREAPRPLRILIPAIGVSAPVVPLGRQPDQTIETPDDWESAGWLSPSRAAAAIIV